MARMKYIFAICCLFCFLLKILTIAIIQLEEESTRTDALAAKTFSTMSPSLSEGSGSITAPNGNATKSNFVCKSNIKGGAELANMQSASIGKTGTFRAVVIARRMMNNSRRSARNLLAESDRSLSLHSDTADERTPLQKSSINENKAVTSEENFFQNFIDIWIGKPISLLLGFAPFAIASHYLDWGPQYIFWLNFLTMVPLASILGDFTEEAALHTNDIVGGLLNASFGNAVEVVVAINALMNDEIRVVQASMIGSIFSNLLLVLGCCFFFGGLYYKEQPFSGLNASSGMGLLALSSVAMILPTPFAAYWDIQDHSVLTISRISAVFLLLSYLQLLYFQLFTHRDSFEAEAESAPSPKGGNNLEVARAEEEEEEEEEEASIPMWMALLGLGLTTGLVTKFSDYLVESIDGFCTESGISRTFVGLIILPIVGNAVEHITAVSVAMKDKMDLALGVCIGSCTQIALFVVPVTVIWGWAAGKPMTLNFPVYEIALYILSIFTVSVCLSTGKSNWLLGSVLCVTYVMLAIGFWFEKVENF